MLAASLAAPAAAQTLAPAQPTERRLIKPPPGFTESCERYRWLCENQTAGAALAINIDVLEIAQVINRRVNFVIASETDAENYGVSEYWTLPTNGKGDCEDFVLEKFKLLLGAGLDRRDLSMAIVLDQAGENHVVLVLRHSSGDLVLDSLSSRILLWDQTGYIFLAMQSGANKTEWEVVIDQPRDGNLLAWR